jgi:hypothetical protein
MARPRKNPVNRPTRRHSDEPRNTLTFDNRDQNYVYRVFNDTDGRIEHFQEVGYEVVHENAQLGDSTADSAASVGSAVSKPVGNGVTGVLMRIKREWYDEDQARKQKRVDDSEETLRQAPKADGRYGSVKITHEKR